MLPPTRHQQSWFQRLASGLKRSSDQLTTGIAAVFTKRKLDQPMLDELEDILIQADFGVDRRYRDAAPRSLRSRYRASTMPFAAGSRKSIAGCCRSRWMGRKSRSSSSWSASTARARPPPPSASSRTVRAQGKSVILAAGDTFRAAAIEQLQVWGQRTAGAPVHHPSRRLRRPDLTRWLSAAGVTTISSSSTLRVACRTATSRSERTPDHPGDQESRPDGAARTLLTLDATWDRMRSIRSISSASAPALPAS